MIKLLDIRCPECGYFASSMLQRAKERGNSFKCCNSVKAWKEDSILICLEKSETVLLPVSILLCKSKESTNYVDFTLKCSGLEIENNGALDIIFNTKRFGTINDLETSFSRKSLFDISRIVAKTIDDSTEEFEKLDCYDAFKQIASIANDAIRGLAFS